MGVTLKKYIWILSLVCTITMSFLLAKMAGIFIESTFFPNPLIRASSGKDAVVNLGGQSKKDIDVDLIIGRNFFDPKESFFASDSTDTTDKIDNVAKIDKEQPVKKPKKTSDKAVPTKLDIQLFSTISVGDGRNNFSSCVVKSGRDMNTHTAKDKNPFGKGTQITRILAKRVEFMHDDQLEYVELEDFLKKKTMNTATRPNFNKPQNTIARKVVDEVPTSGEIQQEGDNFKIPRTEIDKALADISRLYTDIRAVPFFEEGRPSGFKLLSVKRGSLFEKLGMRRGDVLRSVNGKTLDIQSGLETFNSLKNESEFKLELQRRGEEKTFSYQII